MNTLLTFAAIEVVALLLLVLLVLVAPEAEEDERGFRVVGPSLWRKLFGGNAAPGRQAAVSRAPAARRTSGI